MTAHHPSRQPLHCHYVSPVASASTTSRSYWSPPSPNTGAAAATTTTAADSESRPSSKNKGKMTAASVPIKTMVKHSYADKIRSHRGVLKPLLVVNTANQRAGSSSRGSRPDLLQQPQQQQQQGHYQTAAREVGTSESIPRYHHADSWPSQPSQPPQYPYDFLPPLPPSVPDHRTAVALTSSPPTPILTMRRSSPSYVHHGGEQHLQQHHHHHHPAWQQSQQHTHPSPPLAAHIQPYAAYNPHYSPVPASYYPSPYYDNSSCTSGTANCSYTQYPDGCPPVYLYGSPCYYDWIKYDPEYYYYYNNSEDDWYAPSPSSSFDSTEDEETSSSRQDAESSKASRKIATQPQHNRAKTVHFAPSVRVVEIPNRLAYAPQVRKTLWSGRSQIRREARRNTVEYMYEHCNWRRAVEEDDFYYHKETAQWVHPAHIIMMQQKQHQHQMQQQHQQHSAEGNKRDELLKRLSKPAPLVAPDSPPPRSSSSCSLEVEHDAQCDSSLELCRPHSPRHVYMHPSLPSRMSWSEEEDDDDNDNTNGDAATTAHLDDENVHALDTPLHTASHQPPPMAVMMIEA